MSTKEFQVRPTEWEGTPEEDLFVLSDMDHVRIPRVRAAFEAWTDLMYHHIDHAEDLCPNSGGVQARTRH
jgi:hypothetical protein